MERKEYVYIDDKLDEVGGRGFLNYRSHELPTWCPGCGFFGITQAMYESAGELGVNNENLCVVSGIGCAGRIPIFFDAYGFHTIHGRSLPVAAGIKMARNELTVFAVGGDGDILGIGSGHLPHIARRNVDVTLFLFDNAIYGLTKGQSSPTTPLGQSTNSHNRGNPDAPLNAVSLALAYGATFVARGFAGEVKEMKAIMKAAIQHKGFSFLHLLSPCVTFDKENITWKNFRNNLVGLPPNHDASNHAEALRLAEDPRPLIGVFYQNTNRPPYHEYLRSTAAGNQKEK